MCMIIKENCLVIRIIIWIIGRFFCALWQKNQFLIANNQKRVELAEYTWYNQKKVMITNI